MSDHHICSYKNDPLEDARVHSEKSGNVYGGEYYKFMRDQLYLGFRRARKLSEMLVDNLEDEGREVTAEKVIWNLKFNEELFRLAFEEAGEEIPKLDNPNRSNNE